MRSKKIRLQNVSEQACVIAIFFIVFMKISEER